ncbi:hypothetical protein dsx2_3249 [Desulfovibrio sp. X2]|uniref:hypothetical protein n=1 Tax=Desulfovibrio sp. X2 TaxID=941449 RepID=UPI000358B08F|nr:hypothetical protein [Desulfovibrio sp. X2]EPR41080.1 hypothetical protein dsx2_3249 [Desulfovibrio sp. X2]
MAWKWPDNTYVNGEWRGLPDPVTGVLTWHGADYPAQWDDATRGKWGVVWSEEPGVDGVPNTIIPASDFVRRFAPEEQAAVWASTEPQVVVLRNLVLSAREGIDLAAPETQDGMTLLVSQGLLARERADAILAP